MKKFIIFALLLPSLAFANIASEINTLLGRFFSFDPPQIEEINIPENPTIEDVVNFRNEINTEKLALQNFEEKIHSSKESLWEIQLEKNDLGAKLEILDQEIGLNTQKIDKLREQKKKWQSKLELITREKSNLKALIRVKKEEYSDMVVTEHVRNESLSQTTSLAVLKWLFSNKTMSQILEDNEKKRTNKQIKKTSLNSLEINRKNIETKEKHVALLLHNVTNLENRIAEEKKIYHDLAEGKSRLIARLEFSEGKLQQEVENYLREQAQSVQELKALHFALDKVIIIVGDDVVIENSEDNKFGSPLSIPLKITAAFRDPTYKEIFEVEHDGTDLYAPHGTDILCPADGIVRKVVNNGYGYSYFIIDHGDDLYTLYGHVSNIFVNEEQVVEKGKIIGQTGGTPGTKGAGFFTTGPHLHFAIFKNGEFVNAEDYLPKIEPNY